MSQPVELVSLHLIFLSTFGLYRLGFKLRTVELKVVWSLIKFNRLGFKIGPVELWQLMILMKLNRLGSELNRLGMAVKPSACYRPIENFLQELPFEHSDHVGPVEPKVQPIETRSSLLLLMLDRLRLENPWLFHSKSFLSSLCPFRSLKHSY